MLTRALFSALSCLHPFPFVIFLHQTIPPFIVLHSLHKSQCQTLLGNSLCLLSVPEVISMGEHNLWEMKVHSKVSFHFSLNVGELVNGRVGRFKMLLLQKEWWSLLFKFFKYLDAYNSTRHLRNKCCFATLCVTLLSPNCFHSNQLTFKNHVVHFFKKIMSCIKIENIIQTRQ